MILIDTNIISEMMRPAPSENVIEWINQQNIDELHVASVTIAEIAYGLLVLTNSKRRHLLEEAFKKAISEGFKGRILAFDETEAHIYGAIMGKCKKLGRPMSIIDGQIAAIAQAHQAILATRNTKDFANCDIELINPFE